MTIHSPGGLRRFVDGVEILVHGRTAGVHKIQDPNGCSIEVRGDDNDVKPLPLVVEPTSQSSASPLFAANGRFTVAMAGHGKCNATLFDDRTNKPVGHRATRDTPLTLTGHGVYYVVTELYDCRLTITPT
jgi:hypothetical protein